MSASTCRNLQSWKNARLRSNINVLYHENHVTSLRTRLPFLRYSSMRRRSNHAASSSHLQLQSTCQRFDQNKLCKHFWLFEDVLSPEWEVQEWLISLSSDHVREQRNELNTVALQPRSLTAVLPEILRLEPCNLFCYWLSWREGFLDPWIEIRGEWRNRIGVARLLSRGDFVLEEHLVRRKSPPRCLGVSCTRSWMRLRGCSASSTFLRNCFDLVKLVISLICWSRDPFSWIGFRERSSNVEDSLYSTH